MIPFKTQIEQCLLLYKQKRISIDDVNTIFRDISITLENDVFIQESRILLQRGTENRLQSWIQCPIGLISFSINLLDVWTGLGMLHYTYSCFTGLLY